MLRLRGNVAAFDSRVAPPTGQAASSRIRADLGRAMAWSGVWLAALCLANWLVLGRLRTAPVLNVVFLATATAVVLDVGAELQARARMGEVEAVWPEHRLYAVNVALATLEHAGIPAFPRSAYHRAL